MSPWREMNISGDAYKQISQVTILWRARPEDRVPLPVTVQVLVSEINGGSTQEIYQKLDHNGGY